MGDRAGFGECFQERGELMLEEDGDEETAGCAGEDAACVSRVPGFADDDGLDTGGDARRNAACWKRQGRAFVAIGNQRTEPSAAGALPRNSHHATA